MQKNILPAAPDALWFDPGLKVICIKKHYAPPRYEHLEGDEVPLLYDEELSFDENLARLLEAEDCRVQGEVTLLGLYEKSASEFEIYDMRGLVDGNGYLQLHEEILGRLRGMRLVSPDNEQEH